MITESLYQEIILDHYKHPVGRGLREPFDAEAHHVNPTCGDEITVRVRMAGDTVADLSYEGQGCSISQASASVLHELVSGRELTEAVDRHQAFVALMQGRGTVEPDEDLLGDGIAFAGVARYPARVKCALLSWMAFRDATTRALADDERGHDD
ncbi:MAG: Fe-S cluster assembly sulfur transfer protein SufU [Jiangellaceae bacterium]